MLFIQQRPALDSSIRLRFHTEDHWLGASDGERYARMRRVTFIVLLGLSSLLLLGCPARWKVVFINGSEQPLSVQRSGGLDGGRRAFTVSQGGSHSELLGDVQRLAVYGTSGT